MRNFNDINDIKSSVKLILPTPPTRKSFKIHNKDDPQPVYTGIYTLGRPIPIPHYTLGRPSSISIIKKIDRNGNLINIRL